MRAMMTGAMCAVMVSSWAYAQPTTTVITHGLTLTSKGAWVQSMAEAVRAGAGGGSVYRYDGATGAWRHLPTISDGSTDHVSLIFNWVDESDGVSVGPNWGYAQAASDALVAALREARYIDGTGPGDLATGRTLHLIGHSRGAVVMSEAARRLVIGGIPVDHLTALDAHPVNGITTGCFGVGDDDWNDPDPQRWALPDGCAEVAFVDAYYRYDGNGCDPDGQPVDGALNVDLVSVLGDGGFGDNDLFGDCVLEHFKVRAFYHGTVDLGASDDGVDCVIDDDWYITTGEGGCSTRHCQGYFYSQIGGGAMVRPPMGAGVDPGEAFVLCNGSFDMGSYAGWRLHGGGGSGVIDGAGFLRLNATGAAMTHNRFFLPDNADSLEYRRRIDGASPDDELVTIVTNIATGAATEIDRLALGTVDGGFLDRSAPLPLGLPSGVYTLTLSIDGGGTGIEAVVNIDDVEIATAGDACNPCPVDINADGVIDTADLGILIGAFGSSAPEADLNADGVVDTADLGILIGGFGVACGA